MSLVSTDEKHDLGRLETGKQTPERERTMSNSIQGGRKSPQRAPRTQEPNSIDPLPMLLSSA